MREPERENRSNLRCRAGARFLDKLEMTTRANCVTLKEEGASAAAVNQ